MADKRLKDFDVAPSVGPTTNVYVDRGVATTKSERASATAVVQAGATDTPGGVGVVPKTGGDGLLDPDFLRSYAPPDAVYVVLAAHADLSAEAVLGAAVIMSGLLASRPAAATAGRLWWVTDAGSERLTRDTGSAWVDLLPTGNVLTGAGQVLGAAYIDATPLAAGSVPTPASGHRRLFVDSSTGRWTVKDDVGTLTIVENFQDQIQVELTAGGVASALTLRPGTGITTTDVGDGVTVIASTGGGSGEANTASNVGAAGVGVFDNKSGVDLRLRKIAAASSKVTVTLNGQEIDLDVPDASTSHKGAVLLATTSSDTTAGHVIQASDTRLSDARTPTGSAGGDLGSTYPNPTVTATHLASALPVAQGGTGAATLAAHGVLVGNGTSAVAPTGTGTAGQVLTSNGASADPTFQTPASTLPSGAANLVVATPNGGSGVASLRALVTTDVPAQTTPSGSAIPKADGAGKLDAGWIPALNQNTTGTAGGLSVTNDVAHGGTGATTLAAHGVVVGNGSSAVAVTGTGTAGEVLTSNGASADPTFQATTFDRVKTSATGRANTDTLADDPDLVTTSLPAGRYKVTMLLFLVCNSTFGFYNQLGGTAVVDDAHWIEQAWDQSGAPITAAVGNGSGGVLLSGDIAFSAMVVGVVSVSTPGTLAVAWAQLSSGANNTILLALSTMTVEKLP